jgi:predicted nucleic acid-binding protein
MVAQTTSLRQSAMLGTRSERPEHFDDVDFIVQHFEMLSIDPALETYGRLKHELEKQGCPIDDFDLLIGAIAKQSNLTLVTHNTKHFSRIPDILLEDWIA